jgi:hypothetical protein
MFTREHERTNRVIARVLHATAPVRTAVLDGNSPPRDMRMH